MVYDNGTYGRFTTFTPDHILVFRINRTKLCANGINAVFFADGQMSLGSCMQTISLKSNYIIHFNQCIHNMRLKVGTPNFTFGFIPDANVAFPGRNATDNQNWIIPPITSMQKSIFSVRFQIKHFQLVCFAIGEQFAHIRTTKHAELMQCLRVIQLRKNTNNYG